MRIKSKIEWITDTVFNTLKPQGGEKRIGDTNRKKQSLVSCLVKLYLA